MSLHRRVLLTGGRAPATLELARALRAGGCEVFLAESVPLTLTALSRAVTRAHRVPPPRSAPEAFAWQLLDLVRREAIDVIVPTCEEVFHVARAAPVLSPHVELFAPTVSQLHRLHHKALFPAWARELDLPSPHTTLVESPHELQREITDRGPALVAKPAFSRFAAHVRVGPTTTDWISDVEISAAQPWVLQERLLGPQLCSWSVVVQGRLQAHAVYPMAWHTQTGATMRWTAAEVPEIEAWVTRFAAATGITGQLGFDWILDPLRGPLPIECNPRLTSGVHLFGPHAGGLVQALFGHRDSPLTPAVGPAHAVLPALLLYGAPELRTLGLREATHQLLHTRDVLWSRHDPLPLWLHWVGYLVFLWWAWREGISAMEASTLDIEWNGE